MSNDVTDAQLAEAASSGDVVAMVKLGLTSSAQSDWGSARAWFTNALRGGELSALYWLVAVSTQADDLTSACEYFEQAQACANAEFWPFRVCGFTFSFDGFSLMANRAWLLQEAEHGDVRAMVGMGELEHAKQNPVSAREWFGRAQSAGNADGRFWLGRLAEDESDMFTARQLWQQAAREGSALAQDRLGLENWIDPREVARSGLQPRWVIRDGVVEFLPPSDA